MMKSHGPAWAFIGVVLCVAVRATGGTGEQASTLRDRIQRHLTAGRVEAAIEAAQRALANHPNDAAVRTEFVSLHVSLARGFMSSENFAGADRALASALKVEPLHAEALRLSRKIAGARAAAPDRVAQARRWVELEWFEPAFNALRQATALLPEHAEAWASDYRRAAIGSGDDHYICKNFHEAFYFYDAAMKLTEAAKTQTRASLTSRWMQSMVHALAEDIDRVDYPQSYWRAAMQHVEAAKATASDGPMLRTVITGLAYEDMGLQKEAAAAYRRAIEQRVGRTMGGVVQQLRRDAIGAVRAAYDPNLTGRREEFWRQHEGGAWKTIETVGFRIHHRNARAGRQVAAALLFHFGRISELLAFDAEEIPWAKRCDVYLHANQRAFQAATGQSKSVRAICVIKQQGGSFVGHEIHAHQRDLMLLSASLSHELTHLVVGAVTRYRALPGALSEGLALHVEPRGRQRQFARLFTEIVRPRGVAELWKIAQTHPPDADFYAEAYRLVWALRTRRSMAAALEETPTTARGLAKTFRFRSFLELERVYLGQDSRGERVERR